jgi:hypothetical protein
VGVAHVLIAVVSITNWNRLAVAMQQDLPVDQ